MLNNLIAETTVNTSHIQRDEELSQAPEKVVYSINKDDQHQALSESFTPKSSNNAHNFQGVLNSDGRLETVRTDRVTTRHVEIESK